MKLVVFGLTISSSWGNGHATLWRGLAGALGARGWSVTFFERDVEYYRDHRDLAEIESGALVLYESAAPEARSPAPVMRGAPAGRPFAVFAGARAVHSQGGSA